MGVRMERVLWEGCPERTQPRRPHGWARPSKVTVTGSLSGTTREESGPGAGPPCPHYRILLEFVAPGEEENESGAEDSLPRHPCCHKAEREAEIQL